MVRGDPVIAQGVLRDPEARMHGAADLIVRSDVLEEMVPGVYLGSDVDRPFVAAPALPDARWHYRVVDIKFSTLALLSG